MVSGTEPAISTVCGQREISTKVLTPDEVRNVSVLLSRSLVVKILMKKNEFLGINFSLQFETSTE